jgi:hypothetical protein
LGDFETLGYGSVDVLLVWLLDLQQRLVGAWSPTIKWCKLVAAATRDK